MQLESTAALGIGFAFDVVRDDTNSSGFRPAEAGLDDQTPLLGGIRLKGFACALQIGFVKHLLLIGGNEKRYEKESPVINRAWAIQQMLICDFGIPDNKVSWRQSAPNTKGNVAAIKAHLESAQLAFGDVVGISHHYHIARIGQGFFPELPIRLVPAEALCLLADPDSRAWLEAELAAGLIQRSLLECKGIADEIRGNYKPLGNPASPAK